MNLTRRILGAATVLAAVTGIASANSLTVSGFYTSPQTVTSLNANSCLGSTTGGTPAANCTQTDWLGAASNNNTPYASISVASFDTTMGNLNGVTVQFTGAIESTIKFTAHGATQVNSYKTSVDLAALALNSTTPYSPYLLDGTGTPCLQTLTIASNHLCLTGVDQTISTIAPGQYADGTVIGPNTYNYYVDTGNVALSSIAGWFTSGAGTVVVPVLGVVHTTTDTTGGNFSAEQTTKAVAQLTVTYDYTPYSSIPEPATMVMMGTALIGTGLLRRRMKKS